MGIGLSKSKYCRGVQCPKMLWMDRHKPEEAEDVLSESLMVNGNRVGDVARGYFGKYNLVEYDSDKTVMAEKTVKFMKAGSGNIAEASFLTDGLYCAVDILHKNGKGYDIIEVKSSTEVKDVYIDDMAFQYYVLKQCGIDVRKVFLMHLNSDYVRHGELDLKELFVLEEFTTAVKGKYSEVKSNIRAIRDYVDTDDEPERDIDTYCEAPYACAYHGYCARHIPEQSVFNVRRLKTEKKYEYYHQGIVTFEDIVKQQPKLSDKQWKQVETAYYGRADEVDTAAIKEFLSELTYPLYHLDFETFQQAIPEYDGLSPYSQIPFQYSLHIEHADGTLEHREFLAKEGTDPRRAVAESLCKDIPGHVCVLAYNRSFEQRVIQSLADCFPDLSKRLLGIRNNIHDLMVPFQKQYYYSRAMQGSYSIKYVLPALCPDDPGLDYQALEGVHNGSEASETFADMPNHTPEEIRVMRNNLLRYCRLDTLAMVKVLEKLRESVKG
ncbi:DUF2779 domain-containing protein [Succiniclasticum ruminis]|uniref:DUF2779 domain-containing protein n=1 Tax=Succiniclasticum ruminis DSM 9236 TaxID=1123323 RepID=A0A1I1YBR7_9FIRM|nr:DUF2779 domain-containing protein [Succiniclasticum ruminis]SFE17055.1 protein of unknown function DUF83 [Succiniclasticum ruminis DSM 9236]